ncbi:hypothetical protein FRC09_004178, partial [Ceratobasidium sp. 395]
MTDRSPILTTLVMQGFRPRNRPSKHSKPQSFEYESHFIEFQGGEAYRCKICTGCPDFTSLSDAVDHESSPDHIEARRQLDRAPPPLALGPVPGEDVPDPMYFEPAEGDPPAPSAVPAYDAPRRTESDWHAAMEHWAKLPNAHFTVPGPALPTDPPSAVYDLFGAANDKWGSKSEQEETNSEPESSVEVDSDIEDIALPTPSPPSEEFEDAPFHDEDGDEDAEPSVQIPLPESSEEWWPFSNREEALFCLMMAFPRAVFSGKELDVVQWFAKKCNVSGMPANSTVESRFKHIIKLLGLESQLVQSELGNYFAVNSLTLILKNEMSNPLTRKELVFFPQDGGKSMDHAANGKRWMEEVDASLAAPMVRKRLPFGHQDYFVHEPLLASVAQSEGSSTLVPQTFMPTRFFQRDGDLFARSHPLVPVDNVGYVIDSDVHVELSLSSFLLPYPELLSKHIKYDLPSPENILGVRSASHLDQLLPWAEPVENPWRSKAEGKITQLPYNIHFFATSNTASPLEMLHKLTEELSEARTNGIATYDCEEGEEVLTVPWVYAMQGDNPMQSELSAHIGLKGKFFCRVCHVRGKDKDREDTVEGEIQRIAEFMQ